MAQKKELTKPDKWYDYLEMIEKKEITKKEAMEKMGITKYTFDKLLEAFPKEDPVAPEGDDEGNGVKEYTPKEYFDKLKDSKQTLESKELLAAFDTALSMYEGYVKSGQEKAAKKLQFIIETIKKEYKLYELGVDTFVYRQDIARYISNVADKVVKVIDLESYERPIPPEIQDVIELTNGVFSRRVIVYTDYTGEDEKKVEKERREKDPILFGIFDDSRTHPLSDRFYFLGDWEDEMCDLTLESIVDEMKTAVGEKITHDVNIPQTFKEMNERMDRLNSRDDDTNVRNTYKNSENLGNGKHDDGPAIDPNDPDDNREYRERNIGEKVANAFRKVRSILGKRK